MACCRGLYVKVFLIQIFEYFAFTLFYSTEVTYAVIASIIDVMGGHAVAQLVRHRATSRKVVGSIPDCVIGIIH